MDPSPPAIPPLGGRYHDILVAGLTFLLTTVSGGFFGALMQRWNWKAQRRAESAKEARQRAFNYLEELAVDLLSQFETAAGAAGEPEYDAAEAKRRAAQRSWRVNGGRHWILTEMYFGPSLTTVLRGIFISTDKSIPPSALGNDDGLGYQFLNKRGQAEDLLRAMLVAIQEGKVQSSLSLDLRVKGAEADRVPGSSPAAP